MQLICLQNAMKSCKFPIIAVLVERVAWFYIKIMTFKTNILKGEVMITKNIEERRVAREILNIIEAICFSEEYKEYRVNYGSRGEIDLIICTIKDRYNVG